MKLQTTRKAINAGFNKVYAISYCAIQYLTHYTNPIAYTCGVYGWNADIYDVAGVALVTGYRPFGESVNYDLVKEYENKARAIVESHKEYDEKKAEVNALLVDFCKAL